MAATKEKKSAPNKGGVAIKKTQKTKSITGSGRGKGAAATGEEEVKKRGHNPYNFTFYIKECVNNHIEHGRGYQVTTDAKKRINQYILGLIGGICSAVNSEVDFAEKKTIKPKHILLSSRGFLGRFFDDSTVERIVGGAEKKTGIFQVLKKTRREVSKAKSKAKKAAEESASKAKQSS